MRPPRVLPPLLGSALLLGAVALVAWGTPGGERTAPPAEAAAAEEAKAGAAARARPRRRTKLRLWRTRYGRILTDRRGRALYLFTRDRKRRSRCYGACARAWPPFRARGRLVAGRGVKRRLLGWTRRRHGRRQVTYRGHPLYFYVGDDEPGEVLCHGVFEFGGVWRVVNRNGRAVR